MQLLIQLLLGGGLIALTFIVQALWFDMILRGLPPFERKVKRLLPRTWKSCILMGVVSAVSLVIILEIWIWGLFYLGVGALPDLESALYFSTSSFTTVGYGDLYLEKDWRMVSSIEAMNGFLIFGWATAFLLEVINYLYRKEGKALDQGN